MAFNLWKRCVFAVLIMPALVKAQEPASPRFDVVSIRVVPPNSEPVLRDIDFTPVKPGGQYIDSRTLLLFMISFAYDVKDPSIRLVGLPNWAKNQAYAVAAKPAEGSPDLPPAENIEQVRLRLRAMLVERFHLQLHTETRQEQVFNLEVAKGGVRIKEVDPPVPPAKEGYVGAAMGDDGGRMIGNKSTMAGLAKALVIFLKRPVVDRTALKGYYDFDVKWRVPETPDGQRPGPSLGTEGIGLLLSTLQNEFGLRVTNATSPVEYWVVDHVEPPTEN
jgi:uncharacterized protein (TIGR03435 family)